MIVRLRYAALLHPIHKKWLYLLIERHGPSAIRVINEFVAANVAERKGELVCLTSNQIDFANNETMLRELTHLNVENFDSALPGNVGLTEYFTTDSKGARAYYDLLEDFMVRFEKLRNEHEKFGDRKIGITALMTMY